MASFIANANNSVTPVPRRRRRRSSRSTRDPSRDRTRLTWRRTNVRGARPRGDSGRLRRVFGIPRPRHTSAMSNRPGILV